VGLDVELSIVKVGHFAERRQSLSHKANLPWLSGSGYNPPMQDALDEIITLVDADDVELGGATKARVHHEGLLHRAFSIFLFNDKGQMLLQRRAAGKYHSPGLWSNTCCGHPRLGEGLEASAHRRLGEELGLAAALTSVGKAAYRTEFDNGLVENEIVHLLGGRSQAEPDLNPLEVWETRWVGRGELEAWMAERPEDFTYWFLRYLDGHAQAIYA